MTTFRTATHCPRANLIIVHLDNDEVKAIPADRFKLSIETHSMSKPFAKDHVQQACDFCDRPATYWTQAEAGERPLSRSVYHCQNHRQVARDVAWIVSWVHVPLGKNQAEN